MLVNWVFLCRNHAKRKVLVSLDCLSSGVLLPANFFEFFSNLVLGTLLLRLSLTMKECHTAEFTLLQTALTEQELELTPDGKYVRWANTNPRHPRNWHPLRKAYDIGVIILLEFYTTAVSTSGATAAKDARHQFGISLTLSIFLYVSSFSLVQGVGNILFPPYSETFGRKGLYVISTAIFSIFCVIIAAVPSPAASVVGRAVTGFVSAIPNVVITGSIEDMFNSRDRIWLVFVYFAIADFGVATGPVMSMHITTRLGWRWVFYISAIVTGFLGGLLLLIKESRPSLLLAREVEHLRKVTGDESLQPLNPDHAPDFRTFVRTALLRPIRLFATEPIVFICAIMQGTSVALIYLFTEALPPIYQSMGFAPAPSSLPFFAIALGFLGNIVTRLWDIRIANRHREKGHPPLPENKLMGLFVAAPALATGLWWFAWVIPPAIKNVHWFVSCLPLFLVGFALNEFSIVLAGYMADSYLGYAASGFAALALARSVLSAMFPLFADNMFNALGSNVAVSVLASVATVFCATPFLFTYYGRRLRERSQFAKYSLQVYTENTVDQEGY